MDFMSPLEAPLRSRGRKRQSFGHKEDVTIPLPVPASRTRHPRRSSASSTGSSPTFGCARTRGAQSPYMRRVKCLLQKRRRSSSERRQASVAEAAQDSRRSPLKDAQNKMVLEAPHDLQRCPLKDAQNKMNSTTGMVATPTKTEHMPTQPTGKVDAVVLNEDPPAVRPDSCVEMAEDEEDGSERHAKARPFVETFNTRSKLEQLVDIRLTNPEKELSTVQQQFAEYMRASTVLVGSLERELQSAESTVDTTRQECDQLQAKASHTDALCQDLQARSDELSARVADMQKQMDEMREELAKERQERATAECAAQQELTAARQTAEDAREQLTYTDAQVNDLEIQAAALREHIATQSDARSSDEVSALEHVIACYSRMTGFTVQVDQQKWDDTTEAFRCFFTGDVGMEGHGFSLTHHLDCNEMEYSPVVHSVNDTPRKSRKRRSVGRDKILSLPEYLREEILFDNGSGSPRFTLLMLQALVGQLEKSSS